MIPLAEGADRAPRIFIDAAPVVEQEGARGALHVVPLRIVPRGAPAPRGDAVRAVLAALLLNAGLITGFVRLLDFRDLPDAPEQIISVEVVPTMPKANDPPPPPSPSPPAPPPAAPPAPVSSAGEAPPPLVAPPPEAAPAQTGPKPVEAAEAPSLPDAQPLPAAPRQATPPVLSAPDGSFVMSAPADPAVPDASSAASASSSRAAAALARALPMDLSMVPSTFRAILAGEGTQTSQAYRGLVYGRIQRAHHAMEEAQARHLKGQVIVSFQVDAQGHAADLGIAVSSGSAALDTLALAMVREAEPFPPPPSGTDTLFNPAFTVGDE